MIMLCGSHVKLKNRRCPDSCFSCEMDGGGGGGVVMHLFPPCSEQDQGTKVTTLKDSLD